MAGHGSTIADAPRKVERGRPPVPQWFSEASAVTGGGRSNESAYIFYGIA